MLTLRISWARRTGGSTGCARYKLEDGLLLGGTIAFAGIVLGAISLIDWITRGSGTWSSKAARSSWEGSGSPRSITRGADACSPAGRTRIASTDAVAVNAERAASSEQCTPSHGPRDRSR